MKELQKNNYFKTKFEGFHKVKDYLIIYDGKNIIYEELSNMNR